MDTVIVWTISDIIGLSLTGLILLAWGVLHVMVIINNKKRKNGK